MRCPVCNRQETKVIDSRLASNRMSVRRRRACQSCGYRFSTSESSEILDLTVVKRDGSREPYRREKVEVGLRKALEKRPVTEDDFGRLVSEIERDIQKKRRDEVTSREIGEIVMNRLKGFDKVAYIRFASVYRSFEDVATFERELKRLLGPSSPRGRVTKGRRKVKK